MMFPVGDDQVHNGHKPYFTWLFLVINIVVFGYQLTLPSEAINEFFYTYGAVPSLIMEGSQRHTLLTSMFMHGGWTHILGNMFFLYVFADNIEATLGNKKFFLFYIVGGIAASTAHILLNPASSVPGIGASGAIAAVLGAYFVMFPHAKIKMINTQTMRATLVPASYFLLFWIGTQLVSGVGALAESGELGGVAWWAHIGGFIFGWIFGLFKGKYGGVIKVQKTPFKKIA